MLTGAYSAVAWRDLVQRALPVMSIWQNLPVTSGVIVASARKWPMIL